MLKLLCNTPCHDSGCEYCKNKLDAHKGLESIFGFDEFRTYDDEPLQENAVKSAIEGDSLLAIFPTGGGKSLTFQLPAIMSGRAVHGLTVVILTHKDVFLGFFKDKKKTILQLRAG